MSASIRWTGLVVAILVAAMPASILAGTITVRQDGSGDYVTISEAVTNASAGDSIDVGPGTYSEELFIDKALTIIGTSGLSATTLDGANTFTPVKVRGAFPFHLEGFTLAHSASVYPAAGGGVAIREGAQATITDCHFADNRTSVAGGGVFLKGPGSRLDVNNCSFAGNHSDGDGGAGYVTGGGTMNVNDCTFIGNSGGPWGAALGNYYSTLNVTGCLFAENVSLDVAGALYYYRASGNVTSCTFHNNTSGYGAYSGTVFMHESPSTSVTHCIMSGDQTSYGLYYLDFTGYHACNVFWNNALGPIAGDVLAPSEVVADPKFCAPMTGNLYLAEDSPAAPENNVCGALMGAYPVACGPVPVDDTTWGRIKHMYKDRSQGD
jgi:hypothetical protein